jgi:hypothetical protein
MYVGLALGGWELAPKVSTRLQLLSTGLLAPLLFLPQNHIFLAIVHFNTNVYTHAMAFSTGKSILKQTPRG